MARHAGAIAVAPGVEARRDGECCESRVNEFPDSGLRTTIRISVGRRDVVMWWVAKRNVELPVLASSTQERGWRERLDNGETDKAWKGRRGQKGAFGLGSRN